jgi:lipoate-protein ligase A
LDRVRRLIKYVFITGDFFVYPERSILDLEAALKNVSSDPPALLQTVRSFFATHQVQIPGVEPDDLYYALQAAIEPAGRNREQGLARSESFGGR